MYISVNDGVVVFATYLIRMTQDQTLEGDKHKLAPFQLEGNTLVLYPHDNLATAEDLLKQLEIPYTIEELIHDPLHIQKTKGVKYASRTECINHCLHDDEPESQIVPNLKKRLIEKDLEIAGLKQKHVDFESRMKKLEIKQTPV